MLLDKTMKFYSIPCYIPTRGAKAEMISEKFTNEYLFQNLGSLPQSLFSVSKLLWLKQNRPEIFARADKAMLICDYLGYLLTGERAIDYALASRTGAFHIGKLTFDEDFLNELGVPVSLFSTPMPTGSIVGMIKKRVAKDLGLSEHCMLVLGSHDQICAALGAGVVKEGDAVDGMGTVECITTVFSKKPSDCTMGEQGYPCVPYAVKGLYCTYMFNYSNGSLVSWFKDELLHGYRGNEENFFSYIEKDMKRAPTGILTLPYFSGAATPYQNIRSGVLTSRCGDRPTYLGHRRGDISNVCHGIKLQARRQQAAPIQLFASESGCQHSFRTAFERGGCAAARCCNRWRWGSLQILKRRQNCSCSIGKNFFPMRTCTPRTRNNIRNIKNYIRR
ncbi:MAG: FGGY-family carbohydrate kinase [Candidatus Borkfalkia sp.]